MTRKQVENTEELCTYINNQCLKYINNQLQIHKQPMSIEDTKYKNVVVELCVHTYRIVEELSGFLPDFFKYYRSTDCKSHQPGVYASLWRPRVGEPANDVRRGIIFMWLVHKFKHILHSEHSEIASDAIEQIRQQAWEIRQQISSKKIETTFEEMCIAANLLLTESPEYAYRWVDMIQGTQMLYVSIVQTSRTDCNPYLIVL